MTETPDISGQVEFLCQQPSRQTRKYMSSYLTVCHRLTTRMMTQLRFLSVKLILMFPACNLATKSPELN